MPAAAPAEGSAAGGVHFTVGERAPGPRYAELSGEGGNEQGSATNLVRASLTRPLTTTPAPVQIFKPLNSTNVYIATTTQSEYGHNFRSLPLRRMHEAATAKAAEQASQKGTRRAHVAARAEADALAIETAMRRAERGARLSEKATAAMAATTKRHTEALAARRTRREEGRAGYTIMSTARIAAIDMARPAEHERVLARRRETEQLAANNSARLSERNAADATHARNLAAMAQAAGLRATKGSAGMLPRRHRTTTAMMGRKHRGSNDGKPAAAHGRRAARLPAAPPTANTVEDGVHNTAVDTRPSPPTTTLSPELHAQLLDELPPASSAEVTRRVYDAHRRREARRTVPVTEKREASSTHGADYVINHRILHAGDIQPAPGSIDLRDFPQQSPAAVIAIMIELAIANRIQPDLLAHVLLGALRIVPRTPGAATELGSYPVPATIRPAYAAGLLARAGISGITEEHLDRGVDQGYFGGRRLHTVANHSSATTGPAVDAIRTILAEHRAKGETLDVTKLLMATPQIPHIFCALGAVEKSGGRWRLIHDGTTGDAINAQSIPAPELRPARITSAAEFERKLVALRERVGPEAAIHIFYRDVKGAYTNLATRPQDCLLSAWNYDNRLEISLRSLFGNRCPGFVCCAVTTAIASATEEDCAAEGIDSFVVSYVDDIGGACVDSHTTRAESILDGHMVGCGMPPAMDKLRLAREINALYLGLLWDTQLMRVSLTPDKRDKARAAAAKVAGARRMRARELQECLGVLDFTAHVQPVLAAFLGGARRCLTGRRPDAWVTISDEARADAALWLPIINAHDGHRLIPQSVREKDAPSVIVDASTTTGLGFFSPEAKLYFSMPLHAAELGDTAHIINKLEQLAAYLGFLAVAYDAAADLKNTRAINIFTDNKTAMGATNKLRSTSKEMSYFTRCIAVHSASLDILPRSTHVPGLENSQADALSRGIVPDIFLGAEWRRLTIPATTLASLLTSEEPWNVDVTFSFVDATDPSAAPATLSAPRRPTEEGAPRVATSHAKGYERWAAQAASAAAARAL